jgi:hypothetical protein
MDSLKSCVSHPKAIVMPVLTGSYLWEFPMKSIKPKNLKTILDGFKNRKILVLGDVMLDEYLWERCNGFHPKRRFRSWR